MDRQWATRLALFSLICAGCSRITAPTVPTPPTPAANQHENGTSPAPFTPPAPAKAPAPTLPAAVLPRPCGSPLPADGCIVWPVGMRLKSESLRVAGDPAVPMRVLAGPAAFYVVPDGFWPEGTVTLTATGIDTDGTPVNLAPATFHVDAGGDGSPVLSRAINALLGAEEVQADRRRAEGVHLPQLLWSDSVWMDKPPVRPEHVESDSSIRLMSTRTVVFRGTRDTSPATTVVLKDGSAWEELGRFQAHSTDFRPSSYPAAALWSPLQWPHIERLAEKGTARILGEEMLSGHQTVLLGVHTSVPDGQRAATTRLWVDKQTGRPLQLMTTEAFGGDDYFRSNGELTRFRYDQIQLSPLAAEFLKSLADGTATGK